MNKFKSIFDFVEFLKYLEIDELYLKKEVLDAGSDEEKYVIVREELEQLRREIGDCKRCALHKGRKNIVFGDGNPFSPIMFVGEAPGAEEDEQGIPFVGKAGRLLTSLIKKAGLDRREVYICNVIKCRPPGNRDPLQEEIEKCSPFLMRQIAIINPEVIVTLGNYAKKVIAGLEEGITKVRGNIFEVEDRKVVPTYHPSFLLRNPGKEEEMLEDIKRAISLLKK